MQNRTTMLVPTEALPNLLCSFCGNYLSVFPIHYEAEQGTFTCGRCPLITELNPVQQVVYEKLAQFMKFPCKYEESGCMENHVPEDLTKHEASCRYQSYFCPLLPLGQCPWLGYHGELFDHFYECHKTFVLKDAQLEIDLINSYEEHYVFVHDNLTFLAYLKCNVARDELYCSVKYFGPPDEGEAYMYKVSLSNDKQENYECVVRPVQTGTLNTTDHEKATRFDICNIKLNLHNPNYILFNIKMSKSDSNSTLAKNKIDLSTFEEEMLRNIECPICFMHMVPPILQCNTGHSICENCIQDVNSCPTCQGVIGNTRNFALEEFTKFIKYPCKYREYGCDFTSSSSPIKAHEAECKHGPFSCPIEGCNWKNKLSRVMSHIQDDHEDNYLDLSVVTFIANPGDREEATFVTNVSGDIFKLYFLYDGATYFWSMQTVGAVDESCRYIFELNIEGRESSERILIRKRCSPLTGNNRAFTGAHSYIELSQNLLQGMIFDDTLNYSYRIIKENVS